MTQEEYKKLVGLVQTLTNQVKKIAEDYSNLKDIFYRTHFIDKDVFSNPVFFRNKINLGDGGTVYTGTVTGTKIGSSSLDKIGFYGATPVIQATAVGAPSGGATVDTQARAAIVSILAVLHNTGLTS